MNQDAISAYRLNRVQSATPVGLVVLLYEAAIASLHRAIYAVEQKSIEKRVSELNRVLAIIGQLQGTLDFDAGGQVAVTLNRFYDVMRGRTLEASIRQSKEILLSQVEQFGWVHQAWQQVAKEVDGPAKMVPPQSSNPRAAEYR